MNDAIKAVTGNFNISLGKISLPIPYWQAMAVAVLVFFLIFMLAKYRRHTADWSLKGAVFGVFFGFLLALILEGFLIIGGRTALTSVLGWENPPPQLATVLDAGKAKLVQVLGITSPIPSSFAKDSPSVQGAIEILQRLNPDDSEKVRDIFCR